MAVKSLNQPNAINQLEEYPRPTLAWYSTILLALLYWLSILDRTILSLLVDPIKADLGISDVQFGMLHGLAFAITFSLFGLLAGTLADRFSRRVIIFASVSIWSLATAACGLAKDFWQLMLARVGVGVGEAGLNPCATSVITDLFPPTRLTLAMAVYSIGASVGMGCAYLFGGVLVDLVSQADSIVLPIVGELSSWQVVFIIVGVPGVFVALLSFTMPEPRRRGLREEAREQARLHRALFAGYSDLFAFMRSRRRFFIHHYAGFGLISIGFVGGAAWYPAHLSREFAWSGSEIGLGLGMAMIVGGFIGKPMCGLVVDAMFARGRRDAQFFYYACCLAMAVPVGIIATTADSPWIFLAGFALFQVLMSPLNALYISSLNLVTPNELRGSGVAFYSATMGLVALSVGPVLIAVFSDYLYGGNALGYGIATMFALFLPLGALVLWFGRKAMDDAVAQAASWETN